MFFRDSQAMIERSFKHILRNPEAVIMAIVVPSLVMFIFGTIFGGVADVYGFNFIDFIVPGVILQSGAQGLIFVGLNANSDKLKGITDRFKTMNISKSSLIIGSFAVGILVAMVSASAIFGIAIWMGFRPQANFLQWLTAYVVIALYGATLTSIFTFAGLWARDAGSVSGISMPFFLLPFFSSAFAPIETLPYWLQGFATHQPMNLIAVVMRNSLLGLPLGNEVYWAIVWCVALIVVLFILSIRLYTRKRA